MKLIDFVLCDDIRYEMGNKVSLIGVYNDTIIFGEKTVADIKWPKAMKLGLYIRSLFTENETFPNKFTVDISYNGKASLSVSGAIAKQSVDEKGVLITVAVVADSFPFHGVGTVNFSIKYFENDKLIVEASPAYNLKVNVASLDQAPILK